MLLPFESLTPLEPLRLGAVTIERYGSLTINESICVQQIVRPTAIELQDIEGEAELLASFELQSILATLLLVSRDRGDWTLELVQERFTVPQIVSASEFLLNERDRWGNAPKVESEEEDTTPKEIDWHELFWRIQQEYPFEPRFSAANFGNCPIVLIEKALEVANDQRLRQLEAEGRVMANIGVLIAATHGVKDPQTRQFNDFEYLSFQKSARMVVSQSAAKSFMRLHKLGRIPQWVEEIVEIDVVRAAAG